MVQLGNLSMDKLPLLFLAILFLGMLYFSRRNKQRAAAADVTRRENMRAGTEVMTTSGLYGTVVSINDDGTALVSVAPGVEVKWTLVALREVTELSGQGSVPVQPSAEKTSDSTSSSRSVDESDAKEL
jgi:preprotein translocase subunit YajC